MSNSTGSIALLSSYKPNIFVEFAQIIPKYSFQLLKMAGVSGGDPNFNPSSDKYLITVVAIPAALFLLALFSMSLMNIGLIARSFCRFCTCYPIKASGTVKMRRQKRLILALSCFSLFLLSSVALLYLANENLDFGITKSQEVLASISVSLNALKLDASSALYHVRKLSEALAKARDTSPDPAAISASPLNTSISSLASQTLALSILMTSLSFQASVVREYISQYLAGINRKIATYVLAAIPVLLAASFPTLACRRNSAGLKWLVACSVVFYYIVVLIGLPAMLATSVLADVCGSPFENLLKAIPSTDAYNTTRYYTTCMGGNPLMRYVDVASAASDAVVANIDSLISAGAMSSLDANVVSMQSATGTIRTAWADARASHVPECSAFRKLYVVLVDEEICGHLFTGLLELSLSMLLASFMLWMCATLAALLIPHFDPAFYAQIYPNDGDSEHSDIDEEEGFEEGKNHHDDSSSLHSKPSVMADTSQAEKDGKAISFDWASLDEEMSLQGSKRAPGVERIPDEDDSMSVSVLTQILNPEDIVHAVAINNAGIEDEL